MVYPVPAEEPPDSIVSTSAVTVEFAKSISTSWFLTGTISFDFGCVIISILFVFTVDVIVRDGSVIKPVE